MSALTLAVLFAVVPILPTQDPESARETSLWTIGKRDGSGAEFALAPDRHSEFTRDGCFAVDRSDPARDWPYVQPGPSDAWAGGRSHTFTVAFGLVAAPTSAGTCRLVLDFVDTHEHQPPRVSLRLNDAEASLRLPAGGGDASIHGEPGKGRPHHAELAFPTAALRAGTNLLQITTAQGSWLLWDHLALTAPAGLAIAPVEGTVIASAQTSPVVHRVGGEPRRLVHASVLHFGAATHARIAVGDEGAIGFDLDTGLAQVDVPTRELDAPTTLPLAVTIGEREVARTAFTMRPARQLTIYLLPHSHTDIGYTELQTRIEQKQVDNLLAGMAAARRTAEYPDGARFVWNVEVLWAAELFLERMPAAQRGEFFAAVKAGQVSLQGMYLNELSGLCRPEELLRLFRTATTISAVTGVPIDSAMISDVPGHTWGMVTAMAQAGIRYLSTAPNYIDRIGDTLVQWENRPFWWLSPSGTERVLVWIPKLGYALSHAIRTLTPRFVDDYVAELDRSDYPYEIAYLRWSGHGDNAVPDPSICDFVRQWNADHAWPRFVIASTSTAFRALEERHGEQLPEVRGEWSPYWEDGAGSSASETAKNRASAERLTQAEALWAMLDPGQFPVREFEAAWRDVLLYSEHTWGAWCSVSDPNAPATREQWDQKQAYAAQADLQSRRLLARVLQQPRAVAFGGAPGAIDVHNTTGWPRSEVVLLSSGISDAGDMVSDVDGRPVPSQRLHGGELAVLVEDLAPFSTRRLLLARGPAHAPKAARVVANGDGIDNGLLRALVDVRSGGIVELRATGIDGNLIDTASGHALGEYLYLVGDDLAQLQSNDIVLLSIDDGGPLVATLRVESQAPGCHSLVREIRLAAGQRHLELSNTVDKQRLVARSYTRRSGKEAIHFAFPFAVPGGRMLLDLPIGAVRPESDLIPGSCRNWLTAGRFADVANAEFGVTWVTLDAPLVEVGALSATLLNSQTDPKAWRSAIEPTQRLFSWVMNNHWHTNYRAFQEGPVTFRYAVLPHRGDDTAEASRFAIGLSQPLLADLAGASPPIDVPLLSLSSPDVIVLGLKPSDDHRAWIVRLYGASGRDADTTLAWRNADTKVWLSDTSEQRRTPADGPIRVPAWGIVTLRAE
ncbi:MAG: hypothetical protein HZB39_12385 [Planctomycetes bacterium]|nr:hypothetical protein [Planctomycetota bacterium]